MLHLVWPKRQLGSAVTTQREEGLGLLSFSQKYDNSEFCTDFCDSYRDLPVSGLESTSGNIPVEKVWLRFRDSFQVAFLMFQVQYLHGTTAEVLTRKFKNRA